MMEPLRAEDPRQVGRYRLEARLGVGGMGRVYLGFSPAGRAVAVKVIHPELARDQAFLARFRGEVTAARQVGGVHTAPVIDAGYDEDLPWLASALVAGPSLAEAVTAGGRLLKPPCGGLALDWWKRWRWSMPPGWFTVTSNLPTSCWPLRGLVERCMVKEPAARPALTELMETIAARPASDRATSAASFWPAALTEFISSYQARLAAGTPIGSQSGEGTDHKPTYHPTEAVADRAVLTRGRAPPRSHHGWSGRFPPAKGRDTTSRSALPARRWPSPQATSADRTPGCPSGMPRSGAGLKPLPTPILVASGWSLSALTGRPLPPGTPIRASICGIPQPLSTITFPKPSVWASDLPWTPQNGDRRASR
jgi:hypothetical protein